jgi:hypothetical protein
MAGSRDILLQAWLDAASLFWSGGTPSDAPLCRPLAVDDGIMSQDGPTAAALRAKFGVRRPAPAMAAQPARGQARLRG